jgi:hypothetical protein
MAKYGLFNSGAEKPYRVIEGTFMEHDGESVTILGPLDRDNESHPIAVIRLDAGQSVQLIEFTAVVISKSGQK